MNRARRSIAIEIFGITFGVCLIAVLLELAAVRVMMMRAVQNSRERTAAIVQRLGQAAIRGETVTRATASIPEFVVAAYDAQGKLLEQSSSQVEVPGELSLAVRARADRAGGAPVLLVEPASFFFVQLSLDSVAAVSSPSGIQYLLMLDRFFPNYHERSRNETILIVAVLTPIVTIAGALLIAARIRRGLRRAAEVVHRIASGELSERLPEDRDDELGALARDFNRMAARVERLIGQLREKEAEKQRMFADWTHEVATPLSSVMGYLEALKSESVAANEEMRRRYVDTAHEQAQALETLRDDLEVMSRLESEGLMLEFSDVDLPALARSEIEALQPAAQRRGVTFEVGGEPVRPCRCDQRRVRQALRNLLSNAIRHSRDAPVTVRIREDGLWMRIEVEDRGEGIPPEDLARVVDRFYRADVSRARSSGGRGLGLSIVQAIAARHSGSLEIESTPGRGTKARLSLPHLPNGS